jgi:SAP domain
MSEDNESTSTDFSDKKLPPKSSIATKNSSDNNEPASLRVLDVNNRVELEAESGHASLTSGLEGTFNSGYSNEDLFNIFDGILPSASPEAEIYSPAAKKPPPPKRFSPDEKQSPRASKKKEYDSDKGYESDEGPCFDAILKEGEQEFEEEAVMDATDAAFSAENEPTDNLVIISDEIIDKMKVSDIKTSLIERGLAHSGNKKTLIERLKKAMVDKVKIVRSGKKPDDLKGFAQGACWRELLPEETIVEEPTNSFKARAPTIPEEDRDFVPVKHNFAEIFDRPVFTGIRLVPIILKNGQVKKNNNCILFERKHRATGGPKITESGGGPLSNGGWEFFL